MSLPLTTKEKRTIRIAAVCVGVYLTLFYGPAVRRYFTDRRQACDALLQKARDLRDLIKPYEDKAAAITNLMGRFRVDPAKLRRSSVVAEASAAIQQAAAAEKVVVGPIRETSGRPSAKEAGSIQFEGNGPIVAVLAFLHNLDHIGFPVIIDTVQFTSDPRMPNGLKVSLTIVVLDFDAWKPKEVKPNV
ncbi:MAG TPA: hypothetical protein VN765_09745 [Candidatus Acidoferrum sp.]|nr:hypothetical protein [Candidatus Acidoferrum sp.]